MIEIKLIAAIDERLGLSKNGKLPWDLPSDRKYFVDHIEKGPVVMGWNTFVTNKFKPYGYGKNTVITHRDEQIEGVDTEHDARRFFENLKESVWVAGGGQIFKEALPYATHLYLTRVEGDYDCDVLFPAFEDNFVLTHAEKPKTENGVRFTYEIWEPTSK